MNFKGTEHYREKASRLSPVTVSNGEQNVGLDTLDYKADLEALCDYVDELEGRLSAPRNKDGLTAGQVYHWQENALKRIAELEQENQELRESIKTK